MSIQGKRVLVTGGSGFLGSHVVAELHSTGAAVFWPKRSEMDCLDANSVRDMLAYIQPDIVIHCAALCGGIGANIERPADFFHANMLMGLNVLSECAKLRIGKVVNIGTTCSYPAFVSGPCFSEYDLWCGYPEASNAHYGVAKRAVADYAIALSQQHDLDYATAILANLYGPGDNFTESGHVIPAIIRKVLEAKKHGNAEVTLWGTGNVTREFLYVEDAAKSIVAAAASYILPTPINIGTGTETSIRETASIIQGLCGWEGELNWDESKPSGQRRRVLNVIRMRTYLGISDTTPLRIGLKKTIEWYKSQRQVEPNRAWAISGGVT